MAKLTVVVMSGKNVAELENFTRSLFCRAQGVELFFCGDTDDKTVSTLREISGEKNSIDFIGGEACAAYNEAAKRATAPLVMFSVPQVTFAPGAVDALCENGGAVICNAASDADGAPKKLLRDNFESYEAFNPAIGVNCVMRSDVIRKNNLLLEDASVAGICAFAVKYSKFDSFSPLHSLLIYNAPVLTENADSFKTVCAAAKSALNSERAQARLSAATLVFYAFSTLSAQDKETCFAELCDAVRDFVSDETNAAWARACFGVDTQMLNGNYSAGDFLVNGQNIMYKEVTLPILADDVVRDFYGGKLSFNTLRRSIAAWLYFKLYRMGGPLKKIGCAVCKRLVGGDFNG